MRAFLIYAKKNTCGMCDRKTARAKFVYKFTGVFLCEECDCPKAEKSDVLSRTVLLCPRSAHAARLTAYRPRLPKGAAVWEKRVCGEKCSRKKTSETFEGKGLCSALPRSVPAPLEWQRKGPAKATAVNDDK